ncbi:CD59 glycoprotein isoform X2 [Vidua macroura]|uniref:CD59 glycoprotein isoform X2 n=1 Tax=Vidua macroura TaxID=187451 RepID=UPI0023A8EF38|nr:CD59 glycoprotein isoform X2 [Vidua macroura]
MAGTNGIEVPFQPQSGNGRRHGHMTREEGWHTRPCKRSWKPSRPVGAESTHEPLAARPEAALLPPWLRQRLPAAAPPRPAPEAAPPGEAAPAEAASHRRSPHTADLPEEGKKHDQDELHPAECLHCSDYFLWLCLLLSEDKPLLS